MVVVHSSTLTLVRPHVHQGRVVSTERNVLGEAFVQDLIAQRLAAEVAARDAEVQWALDPRAAKRDVANLNALVQPTNTCLPMSFIQAIDTLFTHAACINSFDK